MASGGAGDALNQSWNEVLISFLPKKFLFQIVSFEDIIRFFANEKFNGHTSDFNRLNYISHGLGRGISKISILQYKTHDGGQNCQKTPRMVYG